MNYLTIAVQKVSQYLLELVTIFLLWDSIDESVRRGSLYLGFLIGIFTLIKVIQDVRSRDKEDKIKDLRIRREVEAIYALQEMEKRFVEQNKKLETGTKTANEN